MRSVHQVSKPLSFEQANNIAYQVLAKDASISSLAREHQTSRQTIRKERDRVQQIIDQTEDQQEILFYLPITLGWIHQLVLSLVFLMKGSYRNIHQLIKDLFDYSFSSDKIAELMKSTYSTVESIDKTEDLTPIQVGSQDELYHQNKPILTGVDNQTLYTYLIQKADHRDEETWRIHLMDLKEKGFNPHTMINDQAKGLHSANQIEFPHSAHLYDVFHMLDKFQKTCRFFKNRFRSSIADRKDIECYQDNEVALADSLGVEQQYGQIKSVLSTLLSWMHHDILFKAGSDYATRSALYDFILDEMKKLEKIHPHRIGTLRVTLQNKKESLLNFIHEIEAEWIQLSKSSGFSVESFWLMCELVRCDINSDKYAIKSIPLLDIFGDQFDEMESAVLNVLNHVHQASSCCENLNGRVRQVLSARQNISQNFLNVLRFYFNHKSFHRSAVPERVGKTPAELLTGKPHPHWLEMLGYTLFKRAA